METILELKKDIQAPGIYEMAGTRKTQAEWEKLYPNAFPYSITEWFIIISKDEEPLLTEESEIREIVNEIFEREGLSSMSYKSAAMDCCKKFGQMLTNRQKWGEDIIKGISK